MPRTKSLAAQRRELAFIFHRLTAFTSLADREILMLRLRRLIEGNLSDAFFDVAEDFFDKLRRTNPPLVDDARDLFYSTVSEVKCEKRTPEETTTLMAIGVFISAIFKTTPPDTAITEKTAQEIAALLKRHYINPKAKITIFHEMLRGNQGPAGTGAADARELLEKMRACPGVLYAGEHLDVPDGPDDPIVAQENERSFSLFLRHIVVAVTVPAGELTVVHPYHWSELRSGTQAGAEATFDPNAVVQNPWAGDAAEALHGNVRGYNVIVAEPLPYYQGLQFLEEIMAPFRMLPMVMNAVHTANCLPGELAVSIALFCSRPDASTVYASEIRVALARSSDKAHPFSGDCVTLHEGEMNVGIISSNMEAFLHMLGVTDVMVHEEPRYYEVEDGEGRIYVNYFGVSTPLLAPGTGSAPAVPEHQLN